MEQRAARAGWIVLGIVIPTFVAVLGLAFGAATRDPLEARSAEPESDDDLPPMVPNAGNELGDLSGLLELRTRAYEDLRFGRHEAALAGFAEAKAKVERARIREETRRFLLAEACYHDACGLAAADRKGAAVAELERALELGWSDWDQLERDKHLDRIRDEPRVRAALERAKAREGGR